MSASEKNAAAAAALFYNSVRIIFDTNNDIA